jgi:hypothetical protein
MLGQVSERLLQAQAGPAGAARDEVDPGRRGEHEAPLHDPGLSPHRLGAPALTGAAASGVTTPPRTTGTAQHLQQVGELSAGLDLSAALC